MTQKMYYSNGARPYVYNWQGYAYPGSKTSSELGAVLGEIGEAKCLGIPLWVLAAGAVGYYYFKKNPHMKKKLLGKVGF